MKFSAPAQAMTLGLVLQTETDYDEDLGSIGKPTCCLLLSTSASSIPASVSQHSCYFFSLISYRVQAWAEDL